MKNVHAFLQSTGLECEALDGAQNSNVVRYDISIELPEYFFSPEMIRRLGK